MAEIAGLKLIVPSSVSASTGTATVSASGKVTFTTADGISINGVFDSTYDNYLMVMAGVSTTSTSMDLRLRASGSDATGTDYATQFINANGSTVGAARATGGSVGRVGSIMDDNRSGLHVYFYGPALAQPTAMRGVSAEGLNDVRIFDVACTHSLSTAYDGFTLSNKTSMTGALTVYGLSQ